MSIQSSLQATWLVAMVASTTTAQQETTNCANVVYRAWVDSANGQDLGWVGTPPSMVSPQINDTLQPFKTIQAAIDAIQNQIVVSYNPANPTSDQGVVFVLPGTYGPDAPGTVKDVLPIRMRDRVHLKGLNGRACVIRDPGSSVSGSNPVTIQDFFPRGNATNLPNSACGGANEDMRVLVTFSFAGEWADSPIPPNAPMGSQGGTALPWLVPTVDGDTTEVFDAFTLQGGKVQVLFGKKLGFQGMVPDELNAIISNCLFGVIRKLCG